MVKIESVSICSERKVKPFLRWAGGKSWLVKKIDDFLPNSIDNYFEPFLGGASVFIHLKNKGLIKGCSYLSDSNEKLINAYNVLANSPDALYEKLISFKNNKEYYYKIRDKDFKTDVERAAQFIFLNRTSFNGIYRENLNGEYNVPYGNKMYKELFDKKNLYNVSEILEKVSITSHDFMEIKSKIKKGDFVFLDPPYTVAHNNNGFVKYNQKIFSWKDQERLKLLVEYLIEIEAKFILTNASHKSIDELYKGIGQHNYLTRPSVIGGRYAKREKYEEIIITNL